MKMLVTLTPPTNGKATIAGYDLLQEPALMQSIGYVTQLRAKRSRNCFASRSWDYSGTPYQHRSI